MVPSPIHENVYDPIEVLSETLDSVWHKLCDLYDVYNSIPEMETIMADIDMSDPDRAAHDMMANLIVEIMEQVSRFSAWYTKPSRAFGLVSVSDKNQLRPKQILAPEAVMKWESSLNDLSDAFRKNSGLIKASLLVDRLMGDMHSDKDPHVVVSCDCVPKIKIRLRESILVKADLTCDTCKERFHAA
jgi:hypothetical protein